MASVNIVQFVTQEASHINRSIWMLLMKFFFRFQIIINRKICHLTTKNNNCVRWIYEESDLGKNIYCVCTACMSVWSDFLSFANAEVAKGKDGKCDSRRAFYNQ